MGARSGLREFSSIASCRFCFLFRVAGGPSTNEINVQIRFKKLDVLFSNNNFSKQISLLLKPNFLETALFLIWLQWILIESKLTDAKKWSIYIVVYLNAHWISGLVCICSVSKIFVFSWYLNKWTKMKIMKCNNINWAASVSAKLRLLQRHNAKLDFRVPTRGPFSTTSSMILTWWITKSGINPGNLGGCK